jgi:hypothetical protein
MCSGRLSPSYTPLLTLLFRKMICHPLMRLFLPISASARAFDRTLSLGLRYSLRFESGDLDS